MYYSRSRQFSYYCNNLSLNLVKTKFENMQVLNFNIAIYKKSFLLVKAGCTFIVGKQK